MIPAFEILTDDNEIASAPATNETNRNVRRIQRARSSKQRKRDSIVCLFVCLFVCFRLSHAFQKNGWMDFTKSFTPLFVYILIEMTSICF